MTDIAIVRAPLDTLDYRVVRCSKNGRGVLAAAPAVAERREPSDKQKEHQERFQQAILYAKAAQVKPD